jgi:transposase
VTQWAEIRHLHLVDGVSKREVARRLGLDVKTVRRALGQTEGPPVRATPRRGRVLDGCREEIVRLLEQEPKITAKRIGILLGGRAGGLGRRAIRKYVAELRGELRRAEVFVHRTHPPGDTMECDFFEAWVEISGQAHKARCFLAVLPASNTYFVKAYPIERLECLMDGMSAALEWFGGLPRRGVLDNTSLAVKKILPGSDRLETRYFAAFRGAWPLQVDFCAPGKGWEKGSVERGVEYARGLVFCPRPKAESWEALNEAIRRELEADLDRRELPDGRTARQAWVAEREHLRPLPAHRPECCRTILCVADKYGLVRLDRSSYSVPSDHARRSLVAKLYWDHVEVFRGAERVASARRSYQEGSVRIDPLHVLALLEHKHRAVSESTAIQDWKLPPVFHRLRAELAKRMRKSDREWIRVLRLMESHSLEEVEAAVIAALERSSPSLETVRLLLRQGRAAEVELRPAEVSDQRLAAITVAAPVLSAYDRLVEVA